MGRVLVTRPKADAVRTAARLRAAGHDPVVLPLADIRARTVAGPGWDGFDAVAVTSANAVRMAPAARVRRIATLPCHVVGESTAAAARAAGFRSVTVSNGDAASLAAQVLAGTPPDARVLYLCGTVRRRTFERALAAAGRAVEAVETYDTIRHVPASAEAARKLGDRPIDAALVYSPLSGDALAELVAQPTVAPLFAATTFLCISANAAEALAGRPVRFAARPDEDALFALLEPES